MVYYVELRRFLQLFFLTKNGKIRESFRENMSYLNCPDCGKKLHIFGEGKTAEAAARHGLSVLAEMPIDPALAALADAGDIESFQGNWLDATADLLEQ